MPGDADETGWVPDKTDSSLGCDDWSGLDCVETVHRIYHYLDGELTEERRVEISRHLDDCSPCLHAFDFEAELRRVISNRCRDHVPDRLRERIAAAIEHEHRSRAEETS
jgi:mycothiol system anti-sigma-R factor